jgi:RNA polymerase sigma factor (sigma-70 family)
MTRERGRDRQPGDGVRALLARFGEEPGSAAWTEFLDLYAPRILQIIRVCERGEDDAADAFLWVCERLADRHCRRLRRFNPDGPARFETWLGVVVHNLCRDWRRAVSGRRRLQEIVSRLPALDRAVFAACVDRGLPLERAIVMLRASFPAVSRDEFDRSHDRVTSRLADASRPRGLESMLLLDDPVSAIDPAAAGPDPEAALLDRESRDAVKRVVSTLPPGDRLLIALRFQHGLTLAEIARGVGLKDAQSADRRLRAVVDRIRAGIGGR